MTDTKPELVPTDWRMACGKCGRFCGNYGTVYTPHGDRLQYDGYTEMVTCGKCGLQEAREVPVRWGTYAEVWDSSIPPGGMVCATCRMPVESEPCPEHAPEDYNTQGDAPEWTI